jgi:hypothetical protein
VSLLRRLRQARWPALPASSEEASPTVGRSSLDHLPPETIAAMTRVVEQAFPAFPARLAAARAAAEVERLLAERPDQAPPRPLDPTRPEQAGRAEPPVPERCPQCGGTTTVTRIDLTADAGWFQCRDCGLRFGGSMVDHGGNATHPR